MGPDGAGTISAGGTGSADLVIGVFSARSPRQAMILSANEIPAAAKDDFDWYNDPEGLGLKAYKLSDSEEEGG